MKSFNHYKMELRPRSELTTGLVLYGETEPAEMQIENLWKIVDRRTGEELADPKPDFDEFSSSDRMYPSMMNPEVKRRWDLKNYEWEETKAQHAKLRRMVHAQFMQENPNLPVIQGLQGTTYGSEIQSEFKKILSGKQSILKSRMPKAGTGRTIRDELERDNVDINEMADEVVQFQTPESRNTFAVMGVDRAETLRIAGKILASAESSHALEYQYDEEGRLQIVHCGGKPVEMYRYNRMGQRVFSQVSGDQPLEYHYNELGQLVQAGDVAYSYDENGDLTGKKDSHGLTCYRYLKNGQLCGVQLPDGSEIEYRFDKNGFRAEKLIDGKLVQRYYWDNLVTLSAVKDKSGVTRFRYDEDGDAIGMIRNGQKLLLATDQLGSIFAVADLSGNSVQEVLYDSFGIMIQNSRPELVLPLGFAGGLYDSDTGLVHFGYREYDPATGRFISPDPLGYAGGDVDLYGYCGDDPVNFVDRLGLFDESSSDDDGKSESKSSSSGGYAGNDFGPGYDGTSGSAYGPTDAGWGYNTDPGGSHYNGNNTLGGGGGNGHSQNTTHNAQQAKDNDFFGQLSQQALDQLNTVGVQQGLEADKKAQELANKQNQFNAKEQAKKEHKALAEADRLSRARRASLMNNKDDKDKGFFETVYDGVEEALTKGGKAAKEATAKAGKAFVDDSRIWGTTAAAVAMPAVVAGLTFGGKEVLGAAPHMAKNVGKAAKWGKNFAKNTARKADINIRTSKIGTKKNLNLENVGEAATGLIDNQPPSPTPGGWVSAGKFLGAKTLEAMENHGKK
ncbi:RHS repeat domain-containing protein [Desulfovibrio sp. JC022]|uniref:RHS repeat domain-containing protein n=1 Tax=Desulfovibrio sp. JC022 TaxID=2593642 RepID=UPI0013D843DC|nr:RHS repeat-associated core domain-containing protein [Desulfovibrio sp. JC022]NDV23845.1 RHS repeat-associated core domain-containing protein [Desulfovibrio sp. JC022]